MRRALNPQPLRSQPVGGPCGDTAIYWEGTLIEYDSKLPFDFALNLYRQTAQVIFSSTR